MKRRLLPLALVLTPAVFAYACSSSSSDPGTTNTNPEAGPGSDVFVPGTDSSMPTDAPSSGDTSPPPSSNPIDGIAAPTPIATLTGIAAVGPLWHTDSLYFAPLSPDGPLTKIAIPSNVTANIRNPLTAGNEIIGNTFDEKTSTFVSCEVVPGPNGPGGGQIVRTSATGVGTAIDLVGDGGTPPPFNSPKNVVARHSDGMLYISDPGFQTDPNNIVNNHIFRVKPTTNEVITTIADGRPNGLAFSPDQKTLYVSFTGDDPVTSPSKFVKYPVATDGSLGSPSSAGTVATDAQADGVIVDTAGNIYVGVKTGIDVFKPDGTKWGHITTTQAINGLAFGGADKKTVFMTTGTTGVLQVVVKIAGLVD